MPHVLANDLRKSVLQAAFSGTLTERSSLDTPISITLKNAAKEAEALKIKHAKTSDNTDFPFDIPEEWAWCNLPDIGFSGLGKTLNGAKDKGEEKPYLCSINVYWAGVDLTTVKVARFSSSDIKKYRLKKGDLLTCEGGDVGRTIVWESDQEMYYQNALHRVRFFANNNQYYFRYLLMFYKLSGLLDNVSKGMTIKHFVQGALNNLPIPLPPIEEQSRIVARLDELMTKIDEYEKIESELTALHKKFPEDMKKAILQAAMQGNLTEQLDGDGDACQLAKDISVKDKKWKPITEDEIPFSIPDTWTWMRLREFSSITAGGTPNRSEKKYWNGNIPWLKIGNMNGKYVDEADEFITEEGLNNSSAKWVEKGTILYSIFASIGTVSILNYPATTNQAIAAVKLNPSMNRDYMYYVLTGLKSVLVAQGHGMAQMNINQEILKNTPIPIPPVKEQQRIVEKLDQLLPLCDQLEQMVA